MSQIGNDLSMVSQQLLRCRSIRIGDAVFNNSHIFKDDFEILRVGYVCWIGILLETGTQVMDSHMYSSFRKRLLRQCDLIVGEELNLGGLLEYCDHNEDAMLDLLRDNKSIESFKGTYPLMCHERTQVSILSSVVTLERRTLQYAIEMGDEESEAFAIGACRQIDSYLTKIRVERTDLSHKCIEDAISFQLRQAEQLLDLTTWSGYIHLCNRLNCLARCVLDGFDVRKLEPRHGPGAVMDASVRYADDKFVNYHEDARVQYLIRSRDLGCMQDWCSKLLPQRAIRYSKFIAVAKSWKKMRGISAEPVELMFFQQAVFRELDEFFQKDVFWRERVNLHDQVASQRMCRSAYNERYATIDLSAASDSVTLDLVKRVFKGTRLLPWLLGTRSRYVCYPNGRILENSAFAPMGSACCFPVETMVFVLIAELAARDSGVSNKKPCRVFGDDIICSTDAFTLTCAYLTELGFSINMKKSFGDCAYHEACGVEYYKSFNVRPIMFRGRPLGDRVSSTGLQLLQSYGKHCNSLLYIGYHWTRSFLLKYVLDARISVASNGKRWLIRGKDTVFFSEYGCDTGIWSACPTNFQARKRFSTLCRPEVRIVCEKPVCNAYDSECAKVHDIETAKYCLWLSDHQTDDGFVSGDPADTPYEHRMEPFGTRMVPTAMWVCRSVT